MYRHNRILSARQASIDEDVRWFSLVSTGPEEQEVPFSVDEQAFR
jgi:hypothetical protein